MKRLLMLTIVFFLLAPSLSYAHTQTTSSHPEQGEVVTEPLSTISILFETKIEDLSTMKLLKKGNEIPFENIKVNSNQMQGYLSEPLENGSYKVEWKIVGEDGHPITGEIPFTVEVEKVESQDSNSLDESQNQQKSTAQEEKTEKKSEPSVQKSKATNLLVPLLIGGLGVILLISLIIIFKRKR